MPSALADSQVQKGGAAMRLRPFFGPSLRAVLPARAIGKAWIVDFAGSIFRSGNANLMVRKNSSGMA
jgi:hypothetical protein